MCGAGKVRASLAVAERMAVALLSDITAGLAGYGVVSGCRQWMPACARNDDGKAPE